MTKRYRFGISKAVWAILGCWLLILLSSACSDSGPSEAPVGSTALPPSSSKPNGVIGSHEAPTATDVTIHWRAVDPNLPIDKSGLLYADLINHTDVEQAGRLVVVASGLDGRLVERPLGNFRLAAHATQQVDVRVDALPIQSDSSFSFVVVQAETTRPDGFVLRVPTEPRYFHFQPGYGSAFFYGSEEVAQRAPRAALGSPEVSGRFQDASGAWIELGPGSASTAAANAAGSGKQGATSIVITEPDAPPIAPTKTTDPLVFAPTATALYTLCATWRVQYVDSGAGEDIMATSAWQDVPASFAYMYLYNNGVVVWQGNFNVNGCVNLTLSTSTVYTMSFAGISMRWSGGPILHNFSMDSGSRQAIYLSSSFTTPASGQKYTLFFTYNDDVVQTSAIAAAVLSAAWRANQGMIGNSHYIAEVHAPQCGDASDPTCPVAPGNVVRIGLNSQRATVQNLEQSTLMTHWKFMIAHEFGHTVEYSFVGSFKTNYAWGDAPTSLCKCDHVPSEYSFTHCLQSRGDTGAGQLEGFAHAFAARVFNRDWENNGIFVHYKPFKSPWSVPNPTLMPPISFQMLWNVKFMQNFCSAGSAGKGIELDWLQFFYKVTAVATPNRIAVQDLFYIYRRACTNDWYTTCPGTTTVTWSKLLSAAQLLYGSATEPRYLQFRDTGVATGVNQD